MIKNILKGTLIGIAAILPGVSGGTLMVAMGLYDKLIHCINHLFSELTDNIKFLAPILLGAALAFVGLAFAIEPAFEYFPLPTNCLFIGLILGGLPAISENIKDEYGKIRIKIQYVIPFLVFFVMVTGVALIGDIEGNVADLSMSMESLMKLFVVGLILAANVVIPGVSGSMLLLLMGYYTPFIETVNNLLKAVFTLNIEVAFDCCLILAPIGIGTVIGVFSFARIVEMLFINYKIHTYWAIIGLIVASPIGILAVGQIGGFTILDVVASVITLVIGFVMAIKLGD